MSKTIFTKIIEGEIPCYKIYETPYVFAFLDIHPLQPGHTLIVPKVTVDAIDQLEEPFYSEVFSVAKLIAQASKAAFGTTRATYHILGFEVPHAHLHVIPANTMDEVKFLSQPLATSEALESAQKLLLEQIALIESR
ncbi:MAG: HIT family protein [Candidatus Gracilibacteria bacterium]|nr:HIT family protein [Candidatus Gracilibacteria bacterium]